MSDEKEETPSVPPRSGPRLRSVKGPKPARKGHIRYFSRELWEQAEAYYLKSRRTPSDLAAFMKCSRKQARRLINEGYPGQGWPPLAERALLYDRQHADRAQREAAEALRVEANELASIKRDHLTVAKSVRGLGSGFLARIHQALQGISQEVLAPGNEAAAAARGRALEPLARTFRSVVVSMKEMAASEFVWVKGAAPEEEETGRAEAELLNQVTPEQWDYLAKTGRMPPGLTPELLAHLVRMGFQAPVGKAGA